MLRRTMRISARLLLSAAISWTLIPIAVAEPPEDESSKPQKRLHTVPEDGMGNDDWLSGANSIVRAIITKRPDEDLIICVAGCVARDRVVYAQPAEKPPVKAKSAAADKAPEAAAKDTAAKDATPEEAGEAKKAEANDSLTPAFEPTASHQIEAPAAPASEPEVHDAPIANQPEPDAPADDASSNTDPH